MKCRNKKIYGFLVFVCLLAGELQAQHYVGVRGGYGGGMGRFAMSSSNYLVRREMGLLIGYPSVGISWKYYSPESILGGVQVDLQYVTKGYRQRFSTVIDETPRLDSIHNRSVTAIELPFFWQIHFYALKRRLRIYVNLGMYASYFLKSEMNIENIDQGTSVTYPYEFKSVRDNRFEYGLAGGVGVSALFNRFEAFVEARYSFGYSDLLKRGTKYPDHIGLSRSPIDMVNISMGVYYRLGKGGILAPPPGTNRSRETWDSIPVGRPGGAGAQGGSSGQGSSTTGNTNSSNTQNRGINTSTKSRPTTPERR